MVTPVHGSSTVHEIEQGRGVDFAYSPVSPRSWSRIDRHCANLAFACRSLPWNATFGWPSEKDQPPDIASKSSSIPRSISAGDWLAKPRRRWRLGDFPIAKCDPDWTYTPAWAAR